jgi:hypothetical protein
MIGRARYTGERSTWVWLSFLSNVGKELEIICIRETIKSGLLGMSIGLADDLSVPMILITNAYNGLGLSVGGSGRTSYN